MKTYASLFVLLFALSTSAFAAQKTPAVSLSNPNVLFIAMDDLNDLPPAGKKMGPNRYFDHIRKHGQWKNGIQGYLASIHFADAMLGRVLDALWQWR